MFTRIYIGILLSIVLAIAACYGLYRADNERRFSDYQSQALAGAMQQLANSIEKQTPEQRQRYLAIAAKLLGAEHKTEMHTLHSQLRYSTDGDKGFSWRLNAEDVLVFTELTEQQYRGQLLLLIAEQQRSQHSWAQVAASTGLALQVLELTAVQLDPQQKTRLKGGSSVVHYSDDGSFTVYALLRGKNQAIAMGPLQSFNPLPMQLMVAMLLTTIAIITAVSFLLVRDLQSRFTSMRQAVAALGDGKLDTRLNTQGHDELATLSEDINAMAVQIDSLLQSQRTTLQAVSHELRTPITRIRFRLEMLEETVEHTDQSYTNAIRKDLSELESLIDEVLTHHKLAQSQALNKAPVNIAALLTSEIDQLRPLHPALAITLHNQGELHGLGDSQMLQRACRNLLTNAVKHCESTVNIHLSQAAQTLTIAVEDDGQGIAEADRERVFEAFYRVDSSRNKRTGGYGLGLAIVRQIMQLHGGSAAASKSDDLGGARFVLQLPYVEGGHHE